MNKVLELFLTFFKIGLFTFGGGYAMISIIEDNCVEKKSWITHDEMMQMTVIAESTPGPIAINCATFTGYKKAGFMGAVTATLGMIVPSFTVIYIISMFLDNFLETKNYSPPPLPNEANSSGVKITLILIRLLPQINNASP